MCNNNYEEQKRETERVRKRETERERDTVGKVDWRIVKRSADMERRTSNVIK